MQGVSVRLAHASPGRIRLKVDDLKKDPEKATEIEDKLHTIPGIRSVSANPVTGSLLLTYDEPTSDAMELPFAVAQVLGVSLNDLDPEDLRLLMSHRGNGNKLPAASIADALEAVLLDTNAALRRTVGADIGILLPLVLTVLGVRSLLISEKTVLPSWYDYLWFSFSTYFILNRIDSQSEGSSSLIHGE